MELKEPQDYYPIPEEPEGELIDYDAISKTYKTGDKQYTTVYGDCGCKNTVKQP